VSQLDTNISWISRDWFESLSIDSYELITGSMPPAAGQCYSFVGSVERNLENRANVKKARYAEVV